VPEPYEWKLSCTVLRGEGVCKDPDLPGAAKSDWTSSNTAGAPGNDLGSNNRSGFSALPGGWRGNIRTPPKAGGFYGLSDFGNWWSASEFYFDATSASGFSLHYSLGSLQCFNNSKSCGYSVRLVANRTVPTPTISSATAGDGLVTVSWGSVAGTTSYNLYYKAGATVDIATGTKITGVTSPRIVTGLTNGTQYAFAVSAVNGVFEGNLSAVASATTPTVPGSPTISSTTAGDGLVTVIWGSVSGATSYNLYYTAGATVDIATGTKITGVTSPRIVTGLPNGT
jgi:hypothetical protein